MGEGFRSPVGKIGQRAVGKARLQLMNRCRPEKKNTKVPNNMLQNIRQIAKRTVLYRKGKGWKVEKGKKQSHEERVHKTEGGIPKLEASWSQKVCGTSP